MMTYRLNWNVRKIHCSIWEITSRQGSFCVDLPWRAKLEKKNLDLIAANNVKVKGAGFGTDTNVITLISKEDTKELELMSKEAAAMEILNTLMKMAEK